MSKQTNKLPKTIRRKSHNNSRVIPKTFGEHVAEFRRRMFVVSIFFLIGSVLAYVYRHELLAIILAPLSGQQLIYLTPGGGFAFIFQISLCAGALMAAPVFVHQLHAFIRPALPDAAKQSLLRITALATGLIIGGITYGYFVAIPAAIHFLSNFAEGAVMPNLTADSYLSFFLAYTGGLALLSLIPLVLLFRHWISPLTPGGTMQSQQWILLVAFILAAIITPTPDVVNQVMIAGPIIAVYQIGVIAVLADIYRVRHRNKKLADTVSPIVSTPVYVSPTTTNAISQSSSLSPATYATIASTRTTPQRLTPRVKSIDGFSRVSQRTYATPALSRKQSTIPSSPKQSSFSSQTIQRHLSIDGVFTGTRQVA